MYDEHQTSMPNLLDLFLTPIRKGYIEIKIKINNIEIKIKINNISKHPLKLPWKILTIFGIKVLYH